MVPARPGVAWLEVDNAPSAIELDGTALQEGLLQFAPTALNPRLHAGDGQPDPPGGFLLRETGQLGHADGLLIGLMQLAQQRLETIREFLARIGDALDALPRFETRCRMNASRRP